MFLAEVIELIQQDENFYENIEVACNEDTILSYVEEIDEKTGEIQLIPVV